MRKAALVPTPDAPDPYRAKVFRDRLHSDDWRVEKEHQDGSTEIAVFSGPDAYERALHYADRQYRAFDLIELAPYRRGSIAC